MELPAVEKARPVDQLLSSLDEPDEAIDALWRKEVEDRIQAYRAGELKSVSLTMFSQDISTRFRQKYPFRKRTCPPVQWGHKCPF